MATASCEGEGGCTESENMIGTLGNLPDPVVHHIVSFLAITDLTRFGCVSRKCRELYLSVPSLNFDEFSLANTSSCYKRMKLLRSLDKFLIHRGENKMHKFRIRWVPLEYVDHETPCFCGCNEKSRTMAWLHYAVRCNVQVLDLEISIFEDETPLAFPCCIFPCESLRSLSVDMNCKIQIPSFTFVSNLTYLELTNVEIEEESFFKWISQSCKCIEVLNLEDVHGLKNINIESSSLKSLYFEYTFSQTSICHLNISGEKLGNITIVWGFDSPSNKSFNVSAPNLKSFYWVGNLMIHSYMRELVGLEEVGFYLEPEEDEIDHVLDDIGTSHKRSFLVIKEDAMKELYKRGISPTSFGNICYLRLHIGSFVSDLVPSMVFLFGAMTNLSTLYIKSTPPLYDFGSNTSGFDMGYWEQQNLGFIYKLKEVTIELSNGSNGMELARYILEHAQCLEKMVVVYLPHQCDIVKRMLDRSKMISSGTVVFKENRCKRKLV
ncbi:putative F-box domain, FBD domain, leucine-rich repeat domain, L domain-containing protein [Rosa chinensis]|uniref:Putative F-box domain, FBD domain, leucine-rich repeat domain, L domain-containing protein n=2 Tax=Rosa chinensis TaxID=74649 RepID=A0A2P6RC26_ROSCH|nr:putative F-box/FBD/LRR-repeat protein At4g03220 isoform X1 [Rosa chinensis]XP_024189137.1 putative F-box/FBD/LRR-repeat protein At4g03220 isoform X1 [Rosa chinensis]PRQ43975.1 putative F-box domain, FBD domain, leucine-rich repeat domain, L domain-containing protein [Rosa chinensis]